MTFPAHVQITVRNLFEWHLHHNHINKHWYNQTTLRLVVNLDKGSTENRNIDKLYNIGFKICSPNAMEQSNFSKHTNTNYIYIYIQFVFLFVLLLDCSIAFSEQFLNPIELCLSIFRFSVEPLSRYHKLALCLSSCAKCLLIRKCDNAKYVNFKRSKCMRTGKPNFISYLEQG